MKILGIIPARYASTRFPAKALADIGGKSMIERVYRQTLKATRLHDVVIATDHAEIFNHVTEFGGNVCMTRADHVSGTDRCFEALELQEDEFDYVINIQGDEPFIAPEQIDLLASLLDGVTQIATLIKRIDDPGLMENPNTVKVTKTINNHAIYFSRSPIPYIRTNVNDRWIADYACYKHIGMYAYREDVLQAITRLSPSNLEKAESLEQLRWIENGFPIKVAETHLETIGIDTPEDLVRALKEIKNPN